jgi:hypothetical protein
MIAEMRRWRIVMRNDTNLSSSEDLCVLSMVNYMCVVLFASSSTLGFAYKRVIDPRSYPYSNTLNNRFIFPKNMTKNQLCLSLPVRLPKTQNTMLRCTTKSSTWEVYVAWNPKKNSHHLT